MLRSTRWFLLLSSTLLTACYDDITLNSSATGGCPNNDDYVLDLAFNPFGTTVSIWLTDTTGQKIVEDYVDPFTASPAFFNFAAACDETYTVKSGTYTSNFFVSGPGTVLSIEEIHQVPSGTSLTTADPVEAFPSIFFNLRQDLTIHNSPAIDSVWVMNAPADLAYNFNYLEGAAEFRLNPASTVPNQGINESPFIAVRSAVDGTWRGWLVVSSPNNFNIQEVDYNDLLILEEQRVNVSSAEGHLTINWFSESLQMLIELAQFSTGADVSILAPVGDETFTYYWTNTTNPAIQEQAEVQSSSVGWVDMVDLTTQIQVEKVNLDYPRLSWTASGAEVVEGVALVSNTSLNTNIHRELSAPAGTGSQSINLDGFSTGLANENPGITNAYREAAQSLQIFFLRYPSLQGSYRQYLSNVRGFPTSRDAKRLLDFERYRVNL